MADAVWQGEQRPGVPFGQVAVPEVLLHAWGQLQQTQGIRDGVPATANTLADGLVGHAEVGGQLAVGAGGFKGVQVGPLDVLDQREFKPLLRCGDPDRHGNAQQADHPAGLPPSFPGDQLVAGQPPTCIWHRAHQEWLQDAVHPDRVRKVGHCNFVEDLARLARVRLDAVDIHLKRRTVRHLVIVRFRCANCGGGLRGRRDQCVETPPEAPSWRHCYTPTNVAGRAASNRASSSAARARYASAPRPDGSYRMIDWP